MKTIQGSRVATSILELPPLVMMMVVLEGDVLMLIIRIPGLRL
jgi:hypothetical protein